MLKGWIVKSFMTGTLTTITLASRYVEMHHFRPSAYWVLKLSIVSLSGSKTHTHRLVSIAYIQRSFSAAAAYI